MSPFLNTILVVVSLCRYGNAINQMSLTESGMAEEQIILGDGGAVKPNYFKEQCFSSSLLLTWSK